MGLKHGWMKIQNMLLRMSWKGLMIVFLRPLISLVVIFTSHFVTPFLSIQFAN